MSPSRTRWWVCVAALAVLALGVFLGVLALQGYLFPLRYYGDGKRDITDCSIPTSQGQTLKFKFSSPCRRVTMVVLWPDCSATIILPL